MLPQVERQLGFMIWGWDWVDDDNNDIAIGVMVISNVRWVMQFMAIDLLKLGFWSGVRDFGIVVDPWIKKEKRRACSKFAAAGRVVGR